MTAEKTVKQAESDPAMSGGGTLRGSFPGVVIGLIGPITAGAGDIPWEVAVYTSTLGAALVGLQFVFPQKSKDRLHWWIDLRRSHERAAARRLVRRRRQCLDRRLCTSLEQVADGGPHEQEWRQCRGGEGEQCRAQADPCSQTAHGQRTVRKQARLQEAVRALHPAENGGEAEQLLDEQLTVDPSAPR